VKTVSEVQQTDKSCRICERNLGLVRHTK